MSLSPFSPPLPQKAALRYCWKNLHGSSLGLAISQAALQHQAPVVLITTDSVQAQRIAEEVKFFSQGEVPLLHLPDWETLPYDGFSPHQDIVSERLATLYQLPDIKHGLLILPITTLLQRLPPQSYVQGNSLILEQGQTLDRDKLRSRLEHSAYQSVNQVMEHGEFSVRGALLDLFPMGSVSPYRIDLLDNKIDTIRLFDPDTQRSHETVKSVRLLPAHEFPFNPEGIQQFRSAWCEQMAGNPNNCPIYDDVTHQITPAGIEYYLPLFFQETATLFDYLPRNSLFMFSDGLEADATAFWTDIQSRHTQLRDDIERPLLKPQDLYLPVNSLFQKLKAHPQIQLETTLGTGAEDKTGTQIFNTQALVNVAVDARQNKPLHAFSAFLATYSGRVLLTAESTGRRETVLELLNKNSLYPPVFETWQDFIKGDARLGVAVSPLEQSVILNDANITLISEAQLLGERVAQRRQRKRSTVDQDAVVRNLSELSIGSPIVHEDQGVGRYLGLTSFKVGEIDTEFLYLEYAGGDKLYVPVTSLHLVSRFTGTDPDRAPLHKLGNPQWQKARRKAAEKVRDVAVELLSLHARRAARLGHQFVEDYAAYQSFTAAFPFEETPDQQAAIDAVLKDMYSERPMDRLICGDVGFGKTEVAMRAAFVAVQGGKQVAVLVPTTLLAQQHHQNFLDRFADLPIRVEQLSRFRTGKQLTATLNDLETGKVDIVIGTHKLIQGTVKFAELGLVIIDEEHRFGVRQKEQFKALRAEVDILTLTATPIPRSLNMALSELRDLSIIATAPSKRLAIKTFVQEWSKPVLSEAILRELKRGGQVYLLNNNIESMDKVVREVEEMVPEARVQFAHGQMPERELERVMQDFYHRRFNVLVCTTIIETGIDVPTANTIIINRADRFGLAQLYQLRGRVGRSHHRAYAYLITPPPKTISKDAKKRLDALCALEELGVGFTLATHDLEIRGAGEMLGDEQSGHMQAIGFTLYSQLLERAVESLKAGEEPDLERPLDHGTEIDLQTPALLPEDYMPDIHSRLIFYKRIASAADQAILDELQVELIDRFGLLPTAAKSLFLLTAIKLQAQPLGISKIELGNSGGRLKFVAKPTVDPLRIIQLMQNQPRIYVLDSKDNVLRIRKQSTDVQQRIHFLEELLTYLAKK